MTEHSTTPQEQNQSPAPPPRRRRLRRALWALGILLLIVILALAAGYWTLPWSSDILAERVLGEYWQGPIDIGQVSLSLSKPIILHHVTLRDTLGRQWIYAPRIELHLAETPGLLPALSRIVAPNVVVNAYLDQGQINPPLLWPEPTDSEPSPYLDLQDISLPNIQLTVTHTDAPIQTPTTTPDSPLAVLDELRLTGKASGHGSLRFLFKPTFHMETDAEVQLDFHTVDIHNLRQLLGLAPLAGVTPAPLHLTDLKTKPMTYRDGQIRLPYVQARCEEGLLWGGLRMQLEPDMPNRYTAYLRCRNLPLRTIAAALDPSKKIRFGQVMAIVNDVRGDDLGWANLNASAVVMLDEADIQKERVAGDLLRAASQKLTFQADSRSDLRAILRVQDGIMEIQSAKLGNELAAVFIEPGGTVDLTNGVLYFHVLTASLSDLQKIPILNIFANLASNITRLQVVGTWNDPKITKAPIGDLAHSAKEFFRDIVKTGGELPMLLVPNSD